MKRWILNVISSVEAGADVLTEEADTGVTGVTVVETTEIPLGGAIVYFVVVHLLLVPLTVLFLKSAVVPVLSYLVAATHSA